MQLKEGAIFIAANGQVVPSNATRIPRRRALTGLGQWDPPNTAATGSTPRSRQETKAGHLPELCVVAEQPSVTSATTTSAISVEEGEPGAPVTGPTGHTEEDVKHLLEELQTLSVDDLTQRAVDAGSTDAKLAEIATLRTELGGLDVDGLKSKCLELGVAAECVEMAAKGSNPEELLIEVYLRYYLISILIKVLRVTVTIQIDIKLTSYYNGPRCDLCGTKIMDPTWSKLTSPDGVTANLHRSCVEPYKRSNASACFQCGGLLTGSFVVLSTPTEPSEKIKLHARCVDGYKLAVAPKCFVCAKAILGDYYPYEDGKKVHPECNDAFLQSPDGSR